MDQYEQYLDKMNTMNKESAKTQMDFQERLSSTAHQRETKDLIAAGLNPVLSANNGASSPNGAYAQVDSSPISAKFARQNLDRELANARTIAMMNNENALKIAREQMLMNYQLGVYQADKSSEASHYNTDMMQYLKQMDIDNPTSLPGIVSKYISQFMGDDSIAQTGKKAGENGLFHTAYEVAKRWFDINHGYQYSARRVADANRVINKQKEIIAEAKRKSHEVIQAGGTKKQATDAYRKVLSEHGYYKNMFIQSAINTFTH